MARVVLENVTKKFGENAAVGPLSLEIPDQEFVVLLGPSGCGKSTTLNLIAGLEELDSGHIYFNDELVDDKPPDKRDVAMVFQSYALYPHMNVFDNISFSLKIRKMPAEEIKRRVKDAAELLQIADLVGRRPHQLSGGERQRVALARAIVRNPEVFLLDEPLSNLDAQLRVYMRAELKRLHSELKTTFIYVTHDQVEALTMADRIALLRRGVLQQYDTPDQLYRAPSNTFVASFIGSPPMNFVDCTVTILSGRPHLSTDMFPMDATGLARVMQQDDVGREFILGVRPEDLLISTEPVGENPVQAKVYVVEPLGSETIVDVKLGNSIIKVTSRAESPPAVGDPVWIGFNKKRIHLFDRKTKELVF